MFANKIRNIDGVFTRRVEYSVEELKPILAAAYKGVLEDRAVKRQLKLVKKGSKSLPITWDDIVLYIQEFGLFYDPIFPEKGLILWEMLDNVNMASILIRSGADLSTKRPEDKTESSFLHVLWSSKNPKMHKLSLMMIEYGANVNDLDAYGNPPLYSAVKSELFGIVEAILEGYQEGIRYFLFRGYCNTVALALTSPKAADFLELFFKHCCYLDIVDYRVPVADLAAVIKTLVQHGLATRIQLQSILQCVIKQNVKLAKYLIRIKTDDNERLFDVQTLLSEECVRKNPAMIVFLLGEGADINKPVNDNEDYLLHLAFDERSAKIVRLLLQLGANVNASNKLDNTAFSKCSNKREKTAKIMIKHFAQMLSADIAIHEKDLLKICDSPSLLNYYQSCIEELERLKTIEITAGLSAYFLLNASCYELDMLARGSKIMTEVRKNLQVVTLENFANFQADLMQKFEIVVNIRSKTRAKEQELENIFGDTLPVSLVHKIAEYSVDIARLEREYYASCYKRNLTF